MKANNNERFKDNHKDDHRSVRRNSCIPGRRKLIQLYAALLYNAYVKGFIKGEIYTGPLKNLCVPGLNCYSCPGAVGACPLGALQNALASSGVRTPWFILGILMLLGLTLGRTICGWLCPFGLIQEALHRVPSPKLKKNSVTHMLSWVKYVILGVFVIVIPLYYSLRKLPLPAFCKYICPAGTLEGAIGLLINPSNRAMTSMLGIVFARKLIILVLILISCVFIYRAFCRFLCPLGAIYGLFSKLSLTGVRVEASGCTDCGRCVRHCKMDIRHVGDHECIHCGECMSVCKEQAIVWRPGVVPVNRKGSGTDVGNGRKPRRNRIFLVSAPVLLAAVLWFVNRSEALIQKQVYDGQGTQLSAEMEGTAVDGESLSGDEMNMICPSFTVPLYGDHEETFTAGGAPGKPTVINFWATWCNPCVAELPYFQELWTEYAEQIDVVLIHSQYITEDVQVFLEEKGLTLPCGSDTDGSIFTMLGGSTLLPMTVVVDGDGHITFRRTGAVTAGQLREQIEQCISRTEEIAQESGTSAVGEAAPGTPGLLSGAALSGPALSDKKENSYLIKIKDEKGDPVEGVILQVCDEASCQICETDADGYCRYQAAPYPWQIHVQQVPEGFALPEDSYVMDESGGELEIVLRSR